MRNLAFLITNLFFLSLSGQSFQYFSLIAPELGGDYGAGNLLKVESDSNNIYVFAHVPKVIPNISKSEHPIIGSVNYDGTIRKAELIIDTTLIETPFGNHRMIKKNDSVYITLFYVKNKFNPNLGAFELFEINLRQCKIINRKRFYDIQSLDNVDIFTDTEVKDSVFHLVLQEYDKMIPNRYIFEIDLNCQVRKVILINYNLPYLGYRWVSKGNNNTYDLIVDQLIFKGSNFTGKGFLTYLKIDSLGNVIKKKQLPDTGNIYISGGANYTIVKNSKQNFIIGCSERKYDATIDQSRPLIIKTSSEFDTIIWKTNFYPFSDWVSNPQFFINSLIGMKDNSGYVLAGDWHTPPFAQPDYGLLFKTSLDGDSLWTRKYQPVGWDSLRASSVTFKQANCTVYNTIVIAGLVGDNLEGWQKPWLLHVDSDGCLIPGCGEYVNVKDVESGKQKAFEIYPNPVSDKLYMLSRITSKSPLRMSLINLQGEVVLQNKINVNEGVQYIIDIPESLPPSTYILQIMDDKGKVWMSEKIIKEL